MMLSLGFVDGRLGVHDGEESARALADPFEVLGGDRQRGHDVEGRQGDKGDHGEERPVEANPRWARQATSR